MKTKIESTRMHWEKCWSTSTLDYVNKITDELAAIGVPGKRIIEIGAGSGATSIKLAEYGAFVVTADYSTNSVRLIRQNASNQKVTLSCVQADGFHLPFKDNSFDICFHQGLLEHYITYDEMLAEQNRILKKDGILLVDVPQSFSFYTIKKRFLMARGKWFAGWETDFTEGSLRKILTNAGFSFFKSFGRYHIRNIDRIQKKILGRSILPSSIERLYYRLISWCEKSWWGRHTAFSIGMIVKKQ